MSLKHLADDTPPDAEPSNDARASVLIARAAQGDQQAWETLASMYGKRLFALARSRLRDDQMAEDVAQSVFVTLAEKIGSPSLDGYTEQGRFESWLFRVAMNRVRDVARKQRRQREVFSDDRATDTRAVEAADRDEHSEELDALRASVAQLSDQDREVVELRHHAGLSFKQIAHALDVPVGTVLARHHRALRKLRTMIESETTQDASPTEKATR